MDFLKAISYAVLGLLLVFVFSSCEILLEDEEGNLKVYDPVSKSLVPDRPRHQSKDPKYLKATNELGPLRVREGFFIANAQTKTWSSWFFPLHRSETSLFRPIKGELSPLERLDLLPERVSQPLLAAWEASRVAEENEVEHWPGLCHAFAYASLLEPEPVGSRDYDGVRFREGDRKAVLLKSYEFFEPKLLEGRTAIYGEEYSDAFDNIYDLYSDQFHRVLQVEMFEKRQAFLMDYDPGAPKWNVPVHQVAFEIESSESVDRVKVQATLYYQSPHVSEKEDRSDIWDALGNQINTKSYTYELVGVRDQEGWLNVSYGEWTGDSKRDHPDYIVPRPILAPVALRELQRKSLERAVENEFIEEWHLAAFDPEFIDRIVYENPKPEIEIMPDRGEIEYDELSEEFLSQAKKTPLSEEKIKALEEAVKASKNHEEANPVVSVPKSEKPKIVEARPAPIRPLPSTTLAPEPRPGVAPTAVIEDDPPQRGDDIEERMRAMRERIRKIREGARD